MNDNQQESRLRDEILADAHAKAENIIAQAQKDADDIVAKANEASEARRTQRLDEARALAGLRTKTILGDIDMELSRRWLKRQEECIEALLQEALSACLSTTGERRVTSFRALAAEALTAIGSGVSCEVRVNPSDMSFVTSQWLRDIASEIFGSEDSAEYTVKSDERVNGGLAFAAVDGSCMFENTYAKRLSRMKEQLRVTAAADR